MSSIISNRVELHKVVDSIKSQLPETWEAVQAIQQVTRLGEFTKYSEPDDPEGILLEIIAARCLGLSYGDPGPKLPEETCRQCWGDRHVWLGNTWGLTHTKPSPFPNEYRLLNCSHICHKEEVWIA